jgi:hypothetical protein
LPVYTTKKGGKEEMANNVHGKLNKTKEELHMVVASI